MPTTSDRVPIGTALARQHICAFARGVGCLQRKTGRMPQINDNLLRLLGIVFLVLVLGSVGRFIATRKSAHELRAKRMGSLKVWWTLTFLMSVAVLFGKYGTAVLLAIASTLGLKEFVGLVDVRRMGRPAGKQTFGHGHDPSTHQLGKVSQTSPATHLSRIARVGALWACMAAFSTRSAASFLASRVDSGVSSETMRLHQGSDTLLRLDATLARI